jgi:hypothetical protein
MKEGAMKYRAVRQQQLFGTVLEDQSNPASVLPAVRSELIVLLAQLMRSVVDAIERETNDEQDHN